MRVGGEQAWLVLLPGLDGTGALFRRFVAEVEDISALVIGYPTDEVRSVPELVSLVESRLPASGRLVLLGESFSGRVALELAARVRDRVDAVILVASLGRTRPERSWGRWPTRCAAWLRASSPPECGKFCAGALR